MSSPEFMELRALPGNLVAEKARLYPDRRHRDLLFWLQSVSLKPGGLKQLARDLLATFPDRLGSRTMHAKGVNPSVVYNGKELGQIESELDMQTWRRKIATMKYSAFVEKHGVNALYDDESRPVISLGNSFEKPENSAAFLLALCGLQAGGLADFLRELCVDPVIDLESLETAGWCEQAPYFIGLWSALQHFKTRDESEPAHAVTTSIGGIVNETLNHALATNRMVVIEGEAGSGKTHAAKSWADRHPSQVRYITLSGIMTRTGFFQKIADAIGLATCQRKAMELQAKIESFFGLTQMMLVIDEAHHAWPKAMRMTSAPEIIDWINTALVNQGAPVALVVTDQFAKLKERCEKQTGWTSEQLMHRIKRYQKLPARPTEEDLAAVTNALLPMLWSESAAAWIHATAKPKPDASAVKLIVGYALTSRLPMAAVRDAIDESRDLARKAKRDMVTFEDVRAALYDHQIPSDAAMKTAFEIQPRARRGSGTNSPPKDKSKSRIRVTAVGQSEQNEDLHAQGVGRAANRQEEQRVPLPGSRISKRLEIHA
jgi:ABC-type dipeptide/oligopeptide/nickel transport system ATPase component